MQNRFVVNESRLLRAGTDRSGRWSSVRDVAGHGMGIRLRQPSGIQRTDRCPLSQNSRVATTAPRQAVPQVVPARTVSKDASKQRLILTCSETFETAVNSCGEE